MPDRGVESNTCGQSSPLEVEAVIACYREYFHARIASDAQFHARVRMLKGKTLGCFCKPHACHGDVIVEFLEGA